MYQHILFPTDGSDESFGAFDHALTIADTYGAVIHALYVVDTGYQYADADGAAPDWTPVVEGLRKEGRRTLAAVEDRADRTGTEVVSAVRESNRIHRTILDYADEVGADLIVMGTHGRRGLDRWLLGSVTERVVRTADVPVLTVRTATPAAE